MIVSTLSQYPGYEIVDIKGIIISTDLDFSIARNVFNVEEYYEDARKQLEKKAIKLGANAILGLTFSYVANGARIVLMGTAVILEICN